MYRLLLQGELLNGRDYLLEHTSRIYICMNLDLQGLKIVAHERCMIRSH